MAEPITWLAMLAIRTRLEAIRVANGYYTDIGEGRVLIDRTQVGAQHGPYLLVQSDAITPNTPRDSARPSRTNFGLGLRVIYTIPLAAAPEGVSAELLAHRAAADLRRALNTDLRDEAAGLRDLVVSEAVIGQPPEGAGSDAVIVEVSAICAVTDRDVSTP